MNSRKFNLLITLLLVLLSIETVMGWAWTRKKHSYYLKMSGNYFFTDTEYNHNGEKIPYLGDGIVITDTWFREISFNIYYEYGLTDQLMIMGDIPFKSYTSKRTISTAYAEQDEIATTSGFADFRILGAYGILQGSFALTAAAGVKIPMGYSREPENNGPRLGTGYIDGQAYLILGQSFHPLPAYTSGAIGYRYRGGRFNDELYFNAELGYTLGRFFVKAYYELISNEAEPVDIYGQTIVTPLPGGGGAVPDVIVGDHDISKIIPSLTYSIDRKLGIQVEINHVLAGKNTLAGTTYSLSLILTR